MVRETKLDPLYMSQSTGSSLNVEHKPLKPSGTAQQHYVILGNGLNLSFLSEAENIPAVTSLTLKLSFNDTK